MKGIKTALVLGGTNPHISLIKNLKKRGYHTILVDYYENPPAKAYADQHIQESTLNKELMVKIAEENHASLVISSCIDQANVTACYVAEKLNLPKPYDYETALDVTNKILMKNKMMENRIPTAKHFVVTSKTDLNLIDYSLPVIVKPSDCTGSSGVRKAETGEEFDRYLQAALDVSRDDKAVVEEFKDGVEVSIDCFVKDYEAHVILIRQKFIMDILGDSVIQSPGSMSPANVSELALKQIKIIATKLVSIFKLNNTPFLIQAFIKGDSVNIIEFAPRIGGGLSFRTIELNTGFDILNSSVNSFLGEETKLEFSAPKYYLSTNIIYAEPGIFSHVTGVDTLISNGIIKEFYFYKTKGMVIGNDMSTKSRIGAFIIEGNSKDVLLSKLKAALQELEVYDMENKKIMKKEIFDKISF